MIQAQGNASQLFAPSAELDKINLCKINFYSEVEPRFSHSDAV
ncbi:hypothetical protein B6N60_00324 [Richelia sinica FACHB-800]|uniref:Uncharacterized protein n=1 Tax=Richelia sinica FACHB-800 TaxID=1357546 RepID=A0A975T571_9NOST|nr:hypothetical protein B6N60_00324 [Richelia sinica FACHB-800]